MSSYEEENSLRIERVINQIESGEIKIGDTVYCTTNEHNVVVLELPGHELIIEYFKEKKEIHFHLLQVRLNIKQKEEEKLDLHQSLQ